MKTKIPPQALEIEKAVLGIMLMDNESVMAVTELLRTEMFYHQHHQTVFEVITSLANKGLSVDCLTVMDELNKRGELEKIGGGYFITGLTNSVVSAAHFTTHCRIIVQCFLLRELSKVGADLYTKSFETATDPFELIEVAEKRVHELTQAVNSKDFLRIDSTMIDILRDLEVKRHRENHLTGVQTGFPELDRVTCGWQPTDLVILAARPKCGKTAFALNLALNAAISDEGVGFFSMEMSAQQLVKRILSNQASMYLQSLRDARLSDEQMSHLFSNGVQKLAGIPFFIDDTAALTVSEFKAKARRMVKKYKVKLLVVDYLQLFQGDRNKKNQNREQEVSGNARQLKITAKELGVPIICLSQLSREVEKRSSPVPQLSDLRESGAIEQDADMVCFLYKPSEAEIITDTSKQDTVFFKIAAYRNGDIKTIEFDFKGEFQRFNEKGIFSNTFKLLKSLKEEDSFPEF